MPYDPQKTERKWQRVWEKAEIYKTPDKVKGKKNFYCLDMFPYPSGEGLHVGHLHGYIGSDIVSRYLRMKNLNVLHPMGFDAFGLPAENAAIKHGIHPKTWTNKNIRKMRKQLKTIGAIYDWSREAITSEPDYYKWTQWMFLQLYKAGLAYRAKVPCNFCPSCKTVLANEQVSDGKCERCNSEVSQKEIEQWLFKITDYAEDLLEKLDVLDWPETTKLMQKNWIGKSEGTIIKFPIVSRTLNIPGVPPVIVSRTLNIPGVPPVIKDSKDFIEIFTTRVDTLFGCTYLVLAPEHPLIDKLKSEILNLKSLERYIEQSKKKTERERVSELKDKSGIEIKGVLAINPANNREIPIWVADYTLLHYGTGAIMAVPAHDRRDFDFAKKYNLPVIEVIEPSSREQLPERASLVVSDGGAEKSYEGDGLLINSGRFNGMNSSSARERITDWLAKRELAQKAVFYKLRDWLISRQRYWGAPIPMIFCQKCSSVGGSIQAGWQPVKERDLPVLLPQIGNFKPTGEGKSPLAKSKKFIQTTCPKCGGPAERETDTMDTFVCSSWYFFRYADPKNPGKFASKQKLRVWLPVNLYVGGAEHACLHLLYSRFLTKVLRDAGYLSFEEPFLRLRHQGIILGPDNQKMSKSQGNVIPLDKTIERYGADTLRLYEMFMGPFAETTPWDAKGIEGCSRFLQKVWNLFERFSDSGGEKLGDLERLLHKTIKKVGEDIENFRFNTAISTLMILVNQLTLNSKRLTREKLKTLLLLLAPFAPHLAEKLWFSFVILRPSVDRRSEDKQFDVKNSIHSQRWPKHNEKFLKSEKITLVIQVNGRIRDKMEVETGISEEEAKKIALSREKIKKWIEGKKIKKVIFVPGRLINIVV